MMVFIRGSSYVPPSHEKLGDLMGSYVVLAGEIENPVIKAILAHYLFVTIHPYIDGNGRTARLLMNYFLLSSGYSWVTIRADQRIEYFNALKTANLAHDILMFGEFIVGMLEKASGSTIVCNYGEGKRGVRWRAN
jgi:Fic family protein